MNHKLLIFHSPFGGRWWGLLRSPFGRWWGLLLCCLLLTGCWGNRQQPGLLMEADSAMRWGRYEQADSLIGEYRRAMPRRERRDAGRYRQLLTLESKFLHGTLALDDLLLADSLRDYYENKSREDHAKALSILGDVYQKGGDHPAALSYLLKAEDEARQAGEGWLQGIVCRQIGEIYLDQRMFDEMEAYFRRSYDIASTRNDTLRMAYAALTMGKVCTYQQKVDSIVYYYKTAMDLGSGLEQAEDIVPAARYDLADIYLQMEEFDKAAALMPRDTLNDVNWGYWHYQQNHTDSAIFYFKRSLNRYNPHAESEYLRILAQLEQQKGNDNQAFAYYQQALGAEDSIKNLSQTDATRRIQAQYNLNNIKEELQEVQKSTRRREYVIIGLSVSLIIGIMIFKRERRLYQKARDAQIAREQQLRQDNEQKHRLSLQQIQENNHKIVELERLLQQAQQKDEQTVIRQLELDTERLRMENAHIEAHNKKKEDLRKKFEGSSLYLRIKRNAGKDGFKLSQEEWDELASQIDEVYDNFTNRMFALTPMNETERRVCYLIKLSIKPTCIATMLNCSSTTVSMARRRLFKKIHKRNGTTKEFDDFILNF